MDNPPEDPASAQRARRWQLTAIAVVIGGYAALSYYSSARPEAKGLGAGLSIGPIVLIGLALVWRWTPRLVAVLITAALGAALYRFWPALKENYQWSDLVQQAGVYGLLAGSFARTLLGGRVPMCTQLADKLHGPLQPAEIRYTRGATLAWTVFYLALTAAIVILFFAAPQKVWSMFVNFATYGLIAAMFVVDHAIRRRVLPHAKRTGVLAAMRQFLTG